MAQILNIFFFLVFKSVQVFFAWFLFRHFGFRFDYIVLGIYGALSFFQFLFLIIQIFSKSRFTPGGIMFLRYTPLLVLLMETIMVITSLYYLHTMENDIINLYFVFVALSLVGVFFYFVIWGLFSRIIAKTKVIMKSVSIMPYILLVVISFGIPLSYFLLKHFAFEREFVEMDFYLVLASLGVNAIVYMLLLVAKAFRAKATCNKIWNFSAGIKRNILSVTDGNELGAVQSAVVDFVLRIDKYKENITLINNYASEDIKDNVEKANYELDGRLVDVTVATVLYNIPDDIDDDRKLFITRSIVQIIGGYAGEYDAYPVFERGKAFLAFGAPFFYDFQKLHSLDCAVKMFSDFQRLAEEEELTIPVYIGIYTGKAYGGTVNTRGMTFREYIVFGEAVDNSEKIAAVAKKLGEPLLACDDTIEKLKGKFFVDKYYKVKISNKEININKVRI
jgi:hypothetical protein